MSYAEDNNEDLDPEFLGLYPYKEKEKYYIVLIGEDRITILNTPYDTKIEAIKVAKTYKGQYNKAKIHKGEPHIY